MLAHVPPLGASLVSRSQHAVCAPRLPTTSNPTCPTILLLPPCRPVSSAGAAETSGRPLDVSCRARPPAPAADTSTPVRTPKKKSKKLVDINGEVVKDLGNGMFQVKLENGVSVMGHLSGKIRQNRIRIVTGDKVTVELSPYDLTRGRLTYRFKPGEYEKLLEEQEGGKQGSGSAASSRDEE